ncbi:hypothetical protein [Luteolibacter sp.]|uniref:hypothetical protein n=1 Tax=Luteolibacter sp. TaxID=1962973 RepID=UPI0032650C56
MKLAAAAGVIAFLSSGAASAQVRVNEDHHIASGNAFGIPSDPYFARTPYTILWKADKSNQLYEQNGKVVRLNEVTVEVYDVASGKKIASSGWKPLNGEMKVPIGGNHHIRVYAPGKWTADFKEDKEMLLQAASRGELKDGVTVREASKTSLRTKKERVEAVKAGMIKRIEAGRANFGDAGVAALTADLERAAQLASDEVDFAARFEALSKVTIAKISAEREQGAQGNPKASKSTPAAPSATPGSTWTGNGLPPGMQRRADQKTN